MITPTLRSLPAHFSVLKDDFWQRILLDGSLQDCGDLEKLLAGCEIIAALDDLDLLAA